MHLLMCIVLSIVIAFDRAIRIVCLHDVSIMPIGVEGAHQEEEGMLGLGLPLLQASSIPATVLQETLPQPSLAKLRRGASNKE
jgi:hypothetical protein